MKKDYPRRALSSDTYPTDAWLMEIFEDWFDPCPLNPDWTVDGLELDWPHKTFVNPPYSKPGPWVEKAIRENAKGATIALLLKHDVSTKYYALLHAAGANILLVNQRLQFGTGKGAAFPSYLAILHNPDNQAQYLLSEINKKVML